MAKAKIIVGRSDGLIGEREFYQFSSEGSVRGNYNSPDMNNSRNTQPRLDVIRWINRLIENHEVADYELINGGRIGFVDEEDHFKRVYDWLFLRELDQEAIASLKQNIKVYER